MLYLFSKQSKNIYFFVWLRSQASLICIGRGPILFANCLHNLLMVVNLLRHVVCLHYQDHLKVKRSAYQIHYLSLPDYHKSVFSLVSERLDLLVVQDYYLGHFCFYCISHEWQIFSWIGKSECWITKNIAELPCLPTTSGPSQPRSSMILQTFIRLMESFSLIIFQWSFISWDSHPNFDSISFICCLYFWSSIYTVSRIATSDLSRLASSLSLFPLIIASKGCHLLSSCNELRSVSCVMCPIFV